jgi:hypothetical protein
MKSPHQNRIVAGQIIKRDAPTSTMHSEMEVIDPSSFPNALLPLVKLLKDIDGNRENDGTVLFNGDFRQRL